MGSLNVASVAIDQFRQWMGGWGGINAAVNNQPASAVGASYWGEYMTRSQMALGAASMGSVAPYFNPARVVPTGAVNRPRSLAVLACAYMGMPAL